MQSPRKLKSKMAGSLVEETRRMLEAKKKTEIKGGLAELQKRGIKTTSYTGSKG